MSTNTKNTTSGKKQSRNKLVNSITKILSSKKAYDIKVINTSKLTPEFNYMIISTATSKNHIEAIVYELEKFVKENNIKTLGKDTNSKTGWVVYDFIDAVLHVMTPEIREYYSLERIWEIPED